MWRQILRIAVRLCRPLFLFQQYRSLPQLPSTLQRWFQSFPNILITFSTGDCVILIGPVDGETNDIVNTVMEMLIKWWLVQPWLMEIKLVDQAVDSLLRCFKNDFTRFATSLINTGTRHCHPEPRYLQNHVQDTWKLKVCNRTFFS